MTDATTLPFWAQTDTDLTGRTILVVGGAGGVGEGITRALLVAGAHVVVTARSEAKLAEFSARIGHPQLAVRTLDLLDPKLSESVAALRSEKGVLEGVVLSVADWGSQGRKRLIDFTDEEWQEQLVQNQTTIFRAFRALVPAVAATGAIVHINGMSADIPYPGAGAVAVGSAATKSLTRTVAEEEGGRGGPRIHEVVLGVIRTRPRQLAGIDNPAWIPAIDVGIHVAELIARKSPLSSDVLSYFVDPAVGPLPVPPPLK
ncbi:SDR family oxidoreductase [Streptomyces phaeofaciens JCM 4814]|uniref:Short-chain dehydrogenase n=1 Tax=Streptomyces phaeofaciens TaxID=68254 RepID=A0A918M1I5_9ACTN|nr:SDR family oxidoreductase [Streptomyces phaeofaciens]GGT96734.1 short-chain dehydrogenase [Streptomyces phaeofaciens]